MVDGIKTSGTIEHLPSWQDRTGIELFRSLNDRTGELPSTKSRNRYNPDNITFTKHGMIETYFIKVYETINKAGNITWRFEIRGSLHKNFMGENASRFTWDMLQIEINNLVSKLHMPASQIKIDNLEFGVNIHWNCPVYLFLKKSLIGFMRSEFDSYKADKNGRRLGYEYEGSQYTFKIYDKGSQYDLLTCFMRVEKSLNKMQALRGIEIKTLEDLRDSAKVNMLLPNLKDAWDKVTIIDPEIYSRVNSKDFEKLQHYSNPKFWSNLANESERKFKYHKSLLKEIQVNNQDYIHSNISQLIDNEWRLNFCNYTQNSMPTYNQDKIFVPKLPSVNYTRLSPIYPLDKL